MQETQIEQLKSRRQEVVENCELDQIQLPTLDSMDIDSADSNVQPGMYDYSQLRHQVITCCVHSAKCVDLNFDLLFVKKGKLFDVLVLASFLMFQILIKFLQDATSSEKEKLEAEFKAKLASLSLEIEKTAPNLKALDQYEVLREREREAIEEFEVARKEAKEITDKYNSIKQTRWLTVLNFL